MKIQKLTPRKQPVIIAKCPACNNIFHISQFNETYNAQNDFMQFGRYAEEGYIIEIAEITRDIILYEAGCEFCTG